MPARNEWVHQASEGGVNSSTWPVVLTLSITSTRVGRMTTTIGERRKATWPGWVIDIMRMGILSWPGWRMEEGNPSWPEWINEDEMSTLARMDG